MPVIVLETVPRGDEPDSGLPVWIKPTRSPLPLELAEAMRC